MIVTELFHIAIKTSDLSGTVKFYTEVLGLKEFKRPNFHFPGAWLGTPGPTGKPTVHIYAGGPAMGDSTNVPNGTAAIDHVSFTAVGYHEFISNIKRLNLDWRENEVPGGALWQIFIYDPSGVLLEICFDGSCESGPKPDMSEGRAYKAGVSFFNQDKYDAIS